MYGEFKVQVDKDAPYVIEALKGIYPSNNLEATFASSLFAGLFPIDNFIFGVTKTDVFILASITNRVLTVCLENPKNRSDLSQIKNRIDYYHNEIKDGLRSFGIKVSKSRATISIKSFELSGIWISTYTSITSEFTKNWKSIILAPLIGLVAIFLLVHHGLFPESKAADKTTDTVISFISGLIGLFMTLVGIAFSKASNKKFNFTL